MRRTNSVLVFCVAVLTIPTTGWSKGETTRIKIEGDNLKSPIEIVDPGILSQFSIWNGPGTYSYGPDGVPLPPAHLDPERTAGRFIDWPRGMVAERPSGLQRLEVTFYVGVPREPNATRKYVFAYEVDPSNQRGFIYLPQRKNDLISHGVEGNWLYASRRWDEVIMPIISQQAAQLTVGNFNIEIDAKGTVNLKCSAGCAWKELTWTCSEDGQESCTVPVDAHGMTN